MKPTPMSNPVDILQAAMEKEASARDFYGDLANQCRVDFVKDLLLRLQNEEAKHFKLLQKMLTRIGTSLPAV